MSGLERLLVDLVQIAEAPLYSAYRWLGRQLGRDVSISEFLQVTAEAVDRDVLRLWNVDTETGDRTELYEIPPDLERQYMAEPSLDERYDPFGMNLTLGARADVDPEPAWEFVINFEDGTFEITAVLGREGDALDQLARCYPDLHATVTAREDHDAGRHLVGTLSHVTRS